MSNAAPQKYRQLIRWLPGAIISAIAIYAVVRFTRGQNIGEALRSVTPGFVLSLIVLELLSLIVRSVAWKTILGNNVSVVTAFFGVSEGYFLNNVFPFRLGELGRALFVGKASQLGTMHVLSTILIERAFDVVYAASILLITLPLVVGSQFIKPIAITAFVVVIAALIALFLISINRERFHTWIQSRNFRSAFIKNRILPQVNKLLDGLSALAHPGQFFLSLMWIGLTWAVWVALYYLTIRQLSPAAPAWWGGFIASMIALGVAIPSAPANVGVYEATIVGAFAILGVTNTSALAYAIVLHLAQVIVTTAFGLWGMIRDGQSFSTIFSSLMNKKESESIASEEIE